MGRSKLEKSSTAAGLSLPAFEVGQTYFGCPRSDLGVEFRGKKGKDEKEGVELLREP